MLTSEDWATENQFLRGEVERLQKSLARTQELLELAQAFAWKAMNYASNDVTEKVLDELGR